MTYTEKPQETDFDHTHRDVDGPTAADERGHVAAAHPITSPVVMQRIVAGLVLAIALIVLASVLMPGSSTADSQDNGEHSNSSAEKHHQQPHRSHGFGPAGDGSSNRQFNRFISPGEESAPSPDHQAIGDVATADGTAKQMLLGTLEDECYVIEIYVTDEGARYTVFEHGYERPLLVLAEPAEVHSALPDVNIPDMADEAATQIMYAEPDYWLLPD